LLPESCEDWLSRTKTSVWKKGRRLPQLIYSGDSTLEPCRVTFSKVFDLEGCLDYLIGPQNRAQFVTLLDASPHLRTPNKYWSIHELAIKGLTGREPEVKSLAELKAQPQ
jgi:hypothetical protein